MESRHLGFVISLGRRPERLAAFMQHVEAAGLTSFVTFTAFSAVDGSQLTLDHTLRSRIRPWNFANMDERQLRGTLGCALSHMEIWRTAAARSQHVVVFEDDARLIDLHGAHVLQDTLARIPRDADLVWLNDYGIEERATLGYRIRRRLRRSFQPLLSATAVELFLGPRSVRFVEMPSALTTAEAYVITPGFAARLVEGLLNDLGAIDRHIMQFVATHSCRVYQTDPPLFTQADRDDSDTQSQSVVARSAANKP